MKNLLNSVRSSLRTLTVMSCCLFAVAVSTRFVPVLAQQRGTTQRTVQGKVTNKADAPIKGAIVYLKDTHSMAVKSGITTDNGEYRFGQLDQNVDYDLWAESDGKKSATKTISSFNSKNDFLINLKIDK